MSEITEDDAVRLGRAIVTDPAFRRMADMTARIMCDEPMLMINLVAMAALEAAAALGDELSQMQKHQVTVGGLSWVILRERERTARIVAAADKMERLLLDKHLADSLDCVREYREALKP